MLIIICKTSATAVFPSWVSSFSFSSSPGEHGWWHLPCCPLCWVTWIPQVRNHLAGECDVALASVSFHRCLITFWQVSGTKHCQSQDLTLECHLRLGRPWVGNSEMDPSGWCLDIVALNFILAPDVGPCGICRMSYRNRCWCCFVTELGFWGAAPEEVGWSSAVTLK